MSLCRHIDYILLFERMMISFFFIFIYLFFMFFTFLLWSLIVTWTLFSLFCWAAVAVWFVGCECIRSWFALFKSNWINSKSLNIILSIVVDCRQHLFIFFFSVWSKVFHLFLYYHFFYSSSCSSATFCLAATEWKFISLFNIFFFVVSVHFIVG